MSRSRKTTPRAGRAAFDPRLAIGVLLVAASVVGVYAIVSAADETVAVYAAPSALSPGDRVDASDLDTRHVRLGQTTDLYLVPGDIPADGLVVTRPVIAGELVPVSATGSSDSLRLTSLVIASDGRLAASIVSGATVDVWAARDADGVFAAPSVIVSGAIVVRLVETQSIVAGGEVSAVEVLVPRTKVARVLEAVANDDVLTIVPGSLPGGR